MTNDLDKQAMREPRLGIDIGRVIICGDGEDTHFLDGDEAQAMAAPPVAGALPAIAELVRLFEGRVWLVSKCGRRIEERSRRWLDQRDFYRHTGVDPEQLRFCRRRPEKADHALALSLTHFIDDRADVLQHLEGLVPRRFLFGPQRSLPPLGPTLTHVADWRAAVHAIKGT
jgi:hypothetical protein